MTHNCSYSKWDAEWTHASKDNSSTIVFLNTNIQYQRIWY